MDWTTQRTMEQRMGATPATAQVFRGKPVVAFAVLILVNAMWAFQFSGARLATRQLGVALVTLLPLSLATLAIIPFARLDRQLFSRGSRRMLLDILLLGTVGIVPAQIFLVLGVERTLASNASVLTLTVPVFMAVCASIFLHESMTPLRWVAFAVAVLGVGLVSGGDLREARLFRSDYLVGNLYVLLSCAGSAFYNSFSRRALSRYSPAQVLVWSFLVADFELLMLTAFEGPASWLKLAGLTAGVWGSLLCIAVFSLGLSMLLYFAVIQSVEVMQASLSVYLMPVFGIAFSGAVLGEKITLPLVAGSLLIFSASFLITVYEERKRMFAKETS